MPQHVRMDQNPSTSVVVAMPIATKARRARTQTDGEQLPLQGWNEETIEQAFSDARAKGMPLVGLILKVVIAPFVLAGPGKISLMVEVDGSEYVVGALNVIIADDKGIGVAGVVPLPQTQPQEAQDRALPSG